MHSTLFRTVLQSLNKIMFSCAGRNIIDGPTIYKLYKNFKIDLKKSFKCVVSLCLLLIREFQMKKKKQKQRKYMHLNCTISFSVMLSQSLETRPCSHGYDIVPFHFGPFRKVVRRGVVFTRVRKNQAVRSKTGPEIGLYGKVNQKLERYDIVPFRSRVNRSGTISYRFPDLFGIYG